MAGLLDFMKRLGTDAELAKAYQDNPKGVLNDTDLSQVEKDALLSGDLDKVKALSGAEDVNMTHIVITSFEE